MNVNRGTENTALRCALAALAVFLVFQVKSSPASTEAMSTGDRLLAIEEIHQLKARYIRCLDMKDSMCWEGVFAPTFHFKNGTTEWHGPVNGSFSRRKFTPSGTRSGAWPSKSV